MSDKILTVIVPSYNMEKYLPKCLGSLIVAPELMDKLEVIVVNDGSKDRTSEVAHEFKAKYPQTFKVIDKANGHYGSCINAGLKVACGTYVKILDADDSFDTDQFSAYLRTLKVGADAVLNDYVLIDNSGNLLETKYVSNVEPNSLAMHGISYRTQLLHDINYSQTEGIPYTDTEWATIPMLYARNIVSTHLVVYKYMLGREGQSVNSEVLSRGVPHLIVVMNSILDHVVAHVMLFDVDAKRIVEKVLFRLGRMIINLCITSRYSIQYKDKVRKLLSRIERYDRGIYVDLCRSLTFRVWLVSPFLARCVVGGLSHKRRLMGR